MTTRHHHHRCYSYYWFTLVYPLLSLHANVSAAPISLAKGSLIAGTTILGTGVAALGSVGIYASIHSQNRQKYATVNFVSPMPESIYTCGSNLNVTVVTHGVDTNLGQRVSEFDLINIDHDVRVEQIVRDKTGVLIKEGNSDGLFKPKDGLGHFKWEIPLSLQSGYYIIEYLDKDFNNSKESRLIALSPVFKIECRGLTTRSSAMPLNTASISGIPLAPMTPVTPATVEKSTPLPTNVAPVARPSQLPSTLSTLPVVDPQQQQSQPKMSSNSGESSISPNVVAKVPSGPTPNNIELNTKSLFTPGQLNSSFGASPSPPPTTLVSQIPPFPPTYTLPSQSIVSPPKTSILPVQDVPIEPSKDAAVSPFDMIKRLHNITPSPPPTNSISPTDPVATVTPNLDSGSSDRIPQTSPTNSISPIDSMAAVTPDLGAVSSNGNPQASPTDLIHPTDTMVTVTPDLGAASSNGNPPAPPTTTITPTDLGAVSSNGNPQTQSNVLPQNSSTISSTIVPDSTSTGITASVDPLGPPSQKSQNEQDRIQGNIIVAENQSNTSPFSRLASLISPTDPASSPQPSALATSAPSVK